MTDAPMMIVKPLVIIFEAPDGSIITRLHPSEKTGHEAYGLLICDLIRHVANAFKVDEDNVWEWVDKERYNSTTKITRPS